MSQHSHLYQNKAWKALRNRQLQGEPMCRMCKANGVLTVATVCDHIIPHKGDLKKFWEGPFQSLCDKCHNSDKALIENGKIPRPYIGIDGWPT
jgi:5-methylcytosine-specific restriction enzyme A